MVHTPQLVETIVSTLAEYPKIPVVFDPVMVATSGHRLIEEKTITALTEKLFPIADVITPNMDEAAILADIKVETLEDLYTAGAKIKKLGCKRFFSKAVIRKPQQLLLCFMMRMKNFTLLKQQNSILTIPTVQAVPFHPPLQHISLRKKIYLRRFPWAAICLSGHRKWNRCTNRSRKRTAEPFF